MLSGIKIDNSWSFSDKTRKDTSYITHGYHRYPAKFIPQVVSRLLEKYSKVGDLVVDPFGGCGTTLVESTVMGRDSIGVDINPVAVLITKAKITPITPDRLESENKKLETEINQYSDDTKVNVPIHERIDYWFKPTQKIKLAFILDLISKNKDDNIKNFYLCAFSNILKTTSIWLQKSNKPTRDLHKKLYDPFILFLRQVKSMSKGNSEYYKLLSTNKYLDIKSSIYCSDARDIPVKDSTVDLIITSPPYVTSYEYADLHQLTALWLEYTNNLTSFRKRFIGTSYHTQKEIKLNSQIAEEIMLELQSKRKKIAEGVGTYFTEMNDVFIETKRILKKGGKICVVIGNTKIAGVNILNAEVFEEQFINLGFKINEIIKREIPSKNLPSTRDKITGRFATNESKNKTVAYPTEYIIIAEKQ